MAVTSAIWIDVERDLGAAVRAAQAVVTLVADRDTAPERFRPAIELAVAKRLHDAYSAFETALERLVRAADGSVPDGRRWHQDLLRRALQPVQGGRPAILGGDLVVGLSELLAFRHVFRNVYDEFDFRRAAPLVGIVATVIPAAAAEIEAFCRAQGLADPALPRRFPPPA